MIHTTPPHTRWPRTPRPRGRRQPTLPRLIVLFLTIALLLPAPLAAQALIDEPPPIFIDGARLDLLEVDIDVRDAAAVARYRLQLSNPGDGLAEGRILIPVPPGSAVTDLVLSGGPETLEGRLLDAGDAQRIYEDIVRRLIDPALLQSISDTLYEVRAFPVPPGEQRSVSFVVTTPLTADGDQVAVSIPWSRMSPSPARAVVNADVRVSWDVRAAVAPTYTLASERGPGGDLALSWESGQAWQAATDFTLYLTGGDGLLSTQLLSYRPGDEPGYFSLLFALDTQPTARIDRDVILVLDVSGSMEGDKLEQAKQAARFILERLGANDRYGIVSFSRGVDVFGEGLERAANAQAGAGYVDRLLAGGGTNIAGAIATALDLAGGTLSGDNTDADGTDGAARPTTVIFLTDGLATVGPEDGESILAIAQGSAQARTQMFTFGVGYDVDTILLDALARAFLGTSHYVTPDERIDAEVGRLFERIATPVLTDVQIRFDAGGVYDLGPEAITGIFAGTQVMLTGRYDRPGDATVTVRGNTAAGTESFSYPIRFPVRDLADPTVAQLWAQQRVADLLTELRIEGARDSVISQIVAIATQFGIVTPYTSYLAQEPELAFSEAEAEESVAADAAAAPVSGQQAVESASDVEALREGGFSLGAERVRVVRDRSFIYSDGVWIESGYDGSEAPQIVVGSAGFAALIEAQPDLAGATTLGERVIAHAPDGFVLILWPHADDAGAVTLPVVTTTQGGGGNDTATTDATGTNADSGPTTDDTAAGDAATGPNGSDASRTDDTGGTDAATTDVGTDDATTDAGGPADGNTPATAGRSDDGGLSAAAWPASLRPSWAG